MAKTHELPPPDFATDETLYRKFWVTVRPRPRHGINIRGFIMAGIFAAVLLALALYLSDNAKLPNWVVPVGILGGVLSTIAFQRWDMTSRWIRNRLVRSLFILGFLILCDPFYRWCWPDGPDAYHLCFATYISWCLGVYLTIWAQMADQLASKVPVQPLDP